MWFTNKISLIGCNRDIIMILWYYSGIWWIIMGYDGLLNNDIIYIYILLLWAMMDYWSINSWTETSTWWCVLPGDDGDALGKWEWLFHGILCTIGSWVWTWWTMNISPVKKKGIIGDIHVMIDHIQPLVGGLDHDFLWFSHHIGNVIIPCLTNNYIFFRGEGIPSTSIT